MKKILPLLVVGFLVINGFGAVALSEKVVLRGLGVNAVNEYPTNEISGDLNDLKLVIPVSFPNAGEYRIIDTNQGQIIEMGGFGYLLTPGKPMLPVKNFLIALPPGARVQSVEVKGNGATQLSGKYQITPVPGIMPIDTSNQNLIERLQKEWEENNDFIYSSDQAYPSEIGKLTGSGTLRKYSYVSASVCPFKYHPKSGRLIYFGSAQIIINYNLPSSGSYEAQKVEEMKLDALADERASRLFFNYHQMKELYKPGGLKPRTLTETYDYVIITTNDLQEAITSSDFLSWKISLGFNIKIVFISDDGITDQPGVDLAEQIRNFLREYYMSWGIKYVLLVGDYKTIPMRYCSPNPNSLYGKVPTDSYYADLSYPDKDSWNSNHDDYYGVYGQDNPDFLAEVYVGRIPTSDISRITYTLDKIVAFEQDTRTWKNNALHGGAMLFYANEDHNETIDHDVDGARCLDAIEKNIMNGWTISHYSEHEGLSPSVYPFDALTEQAFTADWRNGKYAVVNWAAHGSPTGIGRVIWDWDDGDGIPEHDNGELIWGSFLNTYSHLEGDYPSIVFAVSCSVGYPEPTGDGNLGIDMLTKESFGAAVAVCSATRGAAVSADWATSHAGAEALCYEFNHFMISGPYGPEPIGDALYDSKVYVHDNFGWDHYCEFLNMFDYNLYGDPTLVREGILQVEITKPEKAFYINNNKILPFFTPVILRDIDIEVTASENTDYVEFYIDDVLKNTDNKAPYVWLWDEKAFFRHKIKVEAYDNTGNSASDERVVWIFNI